jgi:Zn-dependent protease with chaperone function
MLFLVRFLVFNLLLGLVAGLLAWLVVLAVVRWLEIRSSTLSFCFFSLPVIKSTLIILGLGLVFPWPRQWFAGWYSLALPFPQALPILLVWAAGSYLVYLLVVQRARRVLLQEARPVAGVAPRLATAFDAVRAVYYQEGSPPCLDDLCCLREQRLEPRLMVCERLNSPLALTDGGDPLVLFPAGLAPQLTEAELQGALAHELAHFALRRPDWCSAGTLQKLTLFNPLASLVGEYLQRQEEKACDAMAVAVVGDPETYAGMLTRCFRFAREQARRGITSQLHGLPRLVGFKPLLSERVEYLLRPAPNPAGWKQSRVVIWLVWAVLVAVLFFTWSR